MAIYKSSFNQKPEKEEKPKKEKTKKIKEKKPSKNINIKPGLICLLTFLLIFVVCCVPNNFLRNFMLGVFGLLTYPLLLLGIFFSCVSLKKTKFRINKKYLTYISVATLRNFVQWREYRHAQAQYHILYLHYLYNMVRHLIKMRFVKHWRLIS